KFNSKSDAVFCGVFDGHGPYGHMVSRKVRDSLPVLLSTQWVDSSISDQNGNNENGHELKTHPTIDCFCSGTTAVTLIKQVSSRINLVKLVSAHIDGNGTPRTNVAVFGSEDYVNKRICGNGSSDIASLYTLQGNKGTNQDAMILWEKFNSKSDAVFCGVFDGHGPYGHMVSRKVRDSLPVLLSTQWVDSSINDQNGNNENGHVNGNTPEEELIEEYWCGQSDVEEKETIPENMVLQGQDLVIGNVGDSRAVLATRDENSSLVPVQLTIDLKPNLPNVFYHCITDQDEFVILATDGVWDVLSNKEAIDIVAAGPSRATAARALVDCECITTPEDEDWSALEGVTRANSLLSIPRIFLGDKRSASWRKSNPKTKLRRSQVKKESSMAASKWPAVIEWSS
nr:probable protein phosphatase 2C 66 [Tanacetum cinerariifolium]